MSTSLTLADPEGEIVSWVLPDRRGRQGLSGRVYLGELAEGQALAVETPVSPTLHIAGTIEHQDGVTTIQLQSDDSQILGRSVAMWSVGEILTPEPLAVFYEGGANGERIEDYLSSRPLVSLFHDARAALEANRDAAVPWVYDPAVVDLIPLNDSFPRFWVAGIHQAPRLKNRIIGEYGAGMYPAPWDDGAPQPLEFYATLRLPDSLGTPRVFDVLMYVQPEQSDHEPSRHVRIGVPSDAGPAGSPPTILRDIIRDHAPLGLAGIDATSFDRVSDETAALYAGTCGGVFGSEGATIREIIQHLAPICGMRVWLGVDDRIHVAMSGYSYQDSQDAQGALVELAEGDVFPRDTSGSPAWRVEIAGDPDDDSSGVARVSIDWSDDQRRIYPLETASSLPVLGQGPGDADRERILSGAWIVPARGADVAGGIQAGMSADAARVELATHLGAGQALRPAQMIRVSHPRGLGLPGLGWEHRLARVDQVETMPGEDSTRLLLTDLGLSERMRLGLLDTVQQWILFAADGGMDISIEQYDAELYFALGLLGYYDAPELHEGESTTLWAPGAEDERYRRSYRIVGVDADMVLLRADWYEPTIPGSVYVPGGYQDSVTGSGWSVMRTDLMDAFYRENFIRSADKESGVFESGREGFQYSAY